MNDPQHGGSAARSLCTPEDACCVKQTDRWGNKNYGSEENQEQGTSVHLDRKWGMSESQVQAPVSCRVGLLWPKMEAQQTVCGERLLTLLNSGTRWQHHQAALRGGFYILNLRILHWVRPLSTEIISEHLGNRLQIFWLELHFAK